MTADLLELTREEEHMIERELYVNLCAKRLTLAPNPEACFQILEIINLGGLIDYIDKNNPSRKAPYHGSQHEAAVVTAVYEGAMYHGVSAWETRSLVLAAALHDYNHSAGYYPDSTNIKCAVMGLKFVVSQFSTGQYFISDRVADLAQELIEVTEYPYVREPKNILEEIMRDADLMMPYLEPVLKQKLFLGLKSEMEFRKPISQCWSNEEFATGVLNFYDKVDWHTEWAKKKAVVLNWNSKLSEVYSLIAKSE